MLGFSLSEWRGLLSPIGAKSFIDTVDSLPLGISSTSSTRGSCLLDQTCFFTNTLPCSSSQVGVDCLFEDLR